MKNVFFASISFFLGLMIFFLVDSYFGVFKREKTPAIYTETSNPLIARIPSEVEWTKVVIDTNLKIPPIDENDWSYPWNTVKHENGFENTSGEPIVKEDTTRLVHNSRCYSIIKESGQSKENPRTRFNFASGNLIGDTLVLEIYDKNASNWETLTFKVHDGEFRVNYNFYPYPYSPEKIRIKVLNQSLSLNHQLPLKNGQRLKSRCKVELQTIIDFPERSDSFNLEIGGSFELEVKR